MARFIYQAKKGPAEIVEGTIEADNEASALLKLSNTGYFPLSIHKEGAASGKGGAFRVMKKVNLHDLTVFTRQLADLLDSGLTLLNALNVVYKQTENKSFQSVIGDIRDYVRDGRPFSEALKKYPRIFSNLYVAMARSGETGGMLEEILARMANFSEAQEMLQSKIKSALAYPAVMATVGFLTIFVLITFVIPKIAGMFEYLDQAMPLPTMILLSISGFAVDYWYILVFVVGFIVFALNRAMKTEEGRLTIDRFKLSMPLLGELTKKAEIASFSMTLATLLQNGVPILDALETVSHTMQNAVLHKEITLACREVRDGVSLSKSLMSKKNFPTFATNMIAVGEESGSIEKSLFKVATSYEREADNTIKTMTSLVEPLMILTMGLVVGFIVVSMLLPIFQMNIIAQ